MNQVRYSIDSRAHSKNCKVGKKVAKQKQDARIKKHMSTSQLPIGPYQEMKQNSSMNSFLVNRPQSSLLTYQNCIDHKRKKRLSVESVGKNQKDSFFSKNSKCRRKSKNSLSFDEQSAFKNKLGQWRKKFNLSCNDMTEDHQIKLEKKSYKSQKRHSINNCMPQGTYKSKKDNDKSKSKKKKSDIKILEIKNQQKGSTTVLNKQKNPFKKKSLTTIIPTIAIHQKKNIKNAKKAKPKKLTVQKDDNSYLDYPINKYIPIIDKKSTGNSHKKSISKHQKPKNKPKFEFSSCLNILSASSGLIKSSEMTIRDNDVQNSRHILRKSELMIEDSESLNLSEIRFYENNSPAADKNRETMRIKRIKIKHKHLILEKIKEKIKEDYPGLNQIQVNFLASVILIQRKWREYALSIKIKKLKIINKSQQDKSSLFLMRETRVHSITIGSKNSQSFQKQLSSKHHYDTGMIRQEVIEQSSIQAQENRNMGKNKNLKICEIGIQVQSLDQTNSIHRSNQKEQKKQQSFFKTIQREQILSKQQQLEPIMTDRAPINDDQILKVKYSLDDQVFPPLTYLEIRSSMLKNTLQRNLHNLNFMLSSRLINNLEYSDKKKDLQLQYKNSLAELKKSKKNIKKGYLKYIQSLQKTKMLSKSGLRRVSSQSGFMSMLYHKIYKFEKTVTESSQSSESMIRLVRRLLIRKQYAHNIKNFFSHIDQKQDKDKLQNVSNLYNESLLSDKFQKKGDIMKSQAEVGQFSISKQMLSIRESSPMINISDFLMKSKRQHIVIDDESEENRIGSDQGEVILTRKRNKQIQQQRILQLILDQLTQELHDDLIQFNTITVQQASPRQPKSTQNTQKQLQNFNLKLNEKFKHQNVRLSPASSSRQSLHYDESLQVKNYLQSLINFLKQKGQIQDIVMKMNKDQGFSSLTYLKFLRDFELPADEYDPILKNQIFIEFQSKFIKKLPQNNQPSFQVNVQFLTIFHRCIFQAFMGQLQIHKKYGDKGKPFPWEYGNVHTPQITNKTIQKIFTESVGAIVRCCMYCCGIIDNKHIFFTQDQLQRIHQQNQDRIIQMLENELIKGNNSWYQIEQHILQFKLQLNQIIEELLFKEVVKDIVKIQLKY